MLFARTLDAIFELMVIVGKELGLGHVVEPAGHIAIDRREQHGVADLDVWHSKELSFAVGCRDLLHEIDDPSPHTALDPCERFDEPQPI
jgi:hypothetical protein